MADYITPLIGLASMAAAAIADKKKKQQEKGDNLADTAYNIKMQEAEKLGAPGAQYLQEAHNALTSNHRIDRTPVNYGQGLGLIGKGIAGNADGIGKMFGSSNASTLANDPIYNAPNTVPDLYSGQLSLPAATGNDYQLGGDLQLPAASSANMPDWGSLNLDDLEE